MTKELPDFENPPVVEVALSVQFDPLIALRTPQIGVLWQQFRDRFPRIEEHPPLDSTIERFGPRSRIEPGVQVRVSPSVPVPRCWFLNESGSELIQIQQDRFVHNWRKVGDSDSYPRYDRHIRPTLLSELEEFTAFVGKENLGEILPNQCEVTYVNRILAGQGWDRHGQLGSVLAPVSGAFSEEFLPEPEEVAVAASFLIPGEVGRPMGRLRFRVDPVYLKADDKPAFHLTLVARGAPLGSGLEGVRGFLDLGREWIVRGFAAITTPTMHKIWGRKS